MPLRRESISEILKPALATCLQAMGGGGEGLRIRGVRTIEFREPKVMGSLVRQIHNSVTTILPRAVQLETDKS